MIPVSKSQRFCDETGNRNIDVRKDIHRTMVITLAQPVSHSMAVVSNGHTFTSIRSSKRVNRKGDANSSRSAEAAENHAEGGLCFACVAVIPQLYAAGKEKQSAGLGLLAPPKSTRACERT